MTVILFICSINFVSPVSFGVYEALSLVVVGTDQQCILYISYDDCNICVNNARHSFICNSESIDKILEMKHTGFDGGLILNYLIR